MGLPRLESELAQMVSTLSGTRFTVSSAKFVHFALRQSVIGLRTEARDGFRAISGIRRAVERSKMTDAQIEKGIMILYKDLADGERLVAKVRNSGGARKCLKRISRELFYRFEAYSKCLRHLQATKANEPTAMRSAVADLWDMLPSGPGDSGEVYTFICLAGPLGWLATAVAATIVVVILTEGETADDDDEEDADGGVCYPDEVLNPSDMVCTPE